MTMRCAAARVGISVMWSHLYPDFNRTQNEMSCALFGTINALAYQRSRSLQQPSLNFSFVIALD